MTTTDQQRPLERLVMRLLCACMGHRYFVARRLGVGARKVRCERCKKAWAMHDETLSFVPWDADFEALYAPGGLLATEGPDSNRGVSQGEVATRRESAQTMAHGCSADGVSVHQPYNAK